jgi:hypothetical protein
LTVLFLYVLVFNEILRSGWNGDNSKIFSVIVESLDNKFNNENLLSIALLDVTVIIKSVWSELFFNEYGRTIYGSINVFSEIFWFILFKFSNWDSKMNCSICASSIPHII